MYCDILQVITKDDLIVIYHNVTALKNLKKIKKLLKWILKYLPHVLIFVETKYKNMIQAKILVDSLQAIGYMVECTFRDNSYDQKEGGGMVCAIKSDLSPHFICKSSELGEQLKMELKHNGVKHLISTSYLKPGYSFEVYQKMYLDDVKLFLQEEYKNHIIHSYCDRNHSKCYFQDQPTKLYFDNFTTSTNKVIASMARDMYANLGFGQFLPPGLDHAMVTSENVTVERAWLPTDCGGDDHLSWKIVTNTANSNVSKTELINLHLEKATRSGKNKNSCIQQSTLNA